MPRAQRCQRYQNAALTRHDNQVPVLLLLLALSCSMATAQSYHQHWLLMSTLIDYTTNSSHTNCDCNPRIPTKRQRHATNLRMTAKHLDESARMRMLRLQVASTLILFMCDNLQHVSQRAQSKGLSLESLLWYASAAYINKWGLSHGVQSPHR